MLVSLENVTAAAARIGPLIHRTPVMASHSLNGLLGAQLFFKCENFQRSGTFKARGAFNSVLSLNEAEAARGVLTSSSGNHAAAVSLAARVRGIHACIVMPKIALASKVAAVHRYGGEIRWITGAAGGIPSSEEYEREVARLQAETGAAVIHPYDDVRTIAGQGTCALEFLQECAELDLILAPVGGGGLLGGTAVAVKALRPDTRVLGCEPAMADDAQRSLRAGHIVPQTNPRTIADGLRTSLGNINFSLISALVDGIVTVSEEGIVAATRLAWETLKIVIEPSSATVLAALLERTFKFDPKTKVGAILSGGNADLERLPWAQPVG